MKLYKVTVSMPDIVLEPIAAKDEEDAIDVAASTLVELDSSEDFDYKVEEIGEETEEEINPDLLTDLWQKGWWF